MEKSIVVQYVVVTNYGNDDDKHPFFVISLCSSYFRQHVLVCLCVVLR